MTSQWQAPNLGQVMYKALEMNKWQSTPILEVFSSGVAMFNFFCAFWEEKEKGGKWPSKRNGSLSQKLSFNFFLGNSELIPLIRMFSLLQLR